MEAKELRIGNWVKRDIDQQIELYDFYNEEEYGLYIKDMFKPIPLTEEWLVKFGFEKDDCDNFDLKDVLIQSWKFCSEFHYVNNHGCSNTNIKYVHSLQNLYFALTREELTIL